MSTDESVVFTEFPVFPLPDFVLFPGVHAPLHIFEPRYRKMVDEALDRDGRFCMATLKPGGRSQSDEPPAFYPTGCTCEIVDYERVIGKRYNIIVKGLSVVNIDEIDSGEPYRKVRASTKEGGEPEAVDAKELVALKEPAFAVFERLQVDAESLNAMFERMKPEEIVDTISFLMPFASEQKVALLEQDPGRARCKSLVATLEQGLREDQ